MSKSLQELLITPFNIHHLLIISWKNIIVLSARRVLLLRNSFPLNYTIQEKIIYKVFFKKDCLHKNFFLTGFPESLNYSYSYSSSPDSSEHGCLLFNIVLWIDPNYLLSEFLFPLPLLLLLLFMILTYIYCIPRF